LNGTDLWEGSKKERSTLKGKRYDGAGNEGQK
jgi:hypothetical protein